MVLAAAQHAVPHELVRVRIAPAAERLAIPDRVEVQPHAVGGKNRIVQSVVLDSHVCPGVWRIALGDRVRGADVARYPVMTIDQPAADREVGRKVSPEPRPYLRPAYAIIGDLVRTLEQREIFRDIAD